jgi:hypothetical protein
MIYRRKRCDRDLHRVARQGHHCAGTRSIYLLESKHAGGEVAAQNGCLVTINELALAARAPGKEVHHCVLLGHSFGGLVPRKRPFE